MKKLSLRVEIILWLSFLMVIAYFDRVNFSIAAPVIMKELGLGPAYLGMIMSGFGIGYMFLNYTGGFLAERFKPRTMLTAIIFLWSVFTLLTGVAWSFASLFIIRIVFGAAEGPMIPAFQMGINLWATPKERGLASGLWLGALPVGVVLGNTVSASIITAWGWKSVFYIYGIAGVIFAYLTWLIVRDSPAQHPRISKEELELIQSSIVKHDGAESVSAAGRTVGQLLSDPWVWVISISYFCVAFVFWVNLNWLPTYFVKVRGSSLLASGIFASLPYIIAAFGAPVMGWLSDHIGKVRSYWLAIGFIIAAPFIAFAVITPSIDISLFCFAVSLFLIMGNIALHYAVAMEIFNRADVARATGVMLGTGSISAVFAPSMVGFIVQSTGSFNGAYFICAGITFLGALMALALAAREKVRHRGASATLDAVTA